MQHDQFQDLLDTLVRRSGIGQEVLGEVLARTSLRAPDETSRVQISKGNPAARRPVDQRPIPQGTVSKAVKALMEEGLLEDGEKVLRTSGGRTLSPLRLGSLYATAGVKIVLAEERPSHVTTALLGLDSSRVLGIEHDTADNWDQVAELVHRHVISLKKSRDQERASHGLEPLRLFGVGVEVGAPVYNGEVMPQATGSSRTPIPLAGKLHSLFEADPAFDRPVPVIVENDVNALAVLATHQVHYADADLVVVGVFDEGVGGGLVMDGRLRRGGDGRAMEIGHLAVGFPPGQEPEPQNTQEPLPGPSHPATAGTGFDARCACGHFGHVDTLAPPRRIQGELNSGGLEQISEIHPLNPEFQRAQKVFTRSGAALGRALAHVSNTVNPSKVIVYVPAVLAEPKPDSAAAAYLTAVRSEATQAFAASDRLDYLTIRSLPADISEAGLLGAEAAAACVLESFIEHALRLDSCPAPRRAPVSQSSAG